MHNVVGIVEKYDFTQVVNYLSGVLFMAQTNSLFKGRKTDRQTDKKTNRQIDRKTRQTAGDTYADF